MGRIIPFVLAMALMILAGCTASEPEPTPVAMPVPTETASGGGGDPLAGVNLDEFKQYVMDAINTADFEALAQLMTDPVTLGLWRSEGTVLSPIEGSTAVLAYDMAEYEVTFPPFPPADIETRMDGTDILTMWGPDAAPVDALYSTGWGENGTGEMFFVITQNEAGAYRIHGVLIAPDGFQ